MSDKLDIFEGLTVRVVTSERLDAGEWYLVLGAVDGEFVTLCANGGDVDRALRALAGLIRRSTGKVPDWDGTWAGEENVGE